MPATSHRGRAPSVAAPPPRATIADVATQAGVAVSTVSRVLNDGPVAAATRTRVQAAIDELGFRPHAGARALAAGPTGAVGMIVPYFSSPSAVERVHGVLDELSGGAHELVLCNVSGPAQREKYLGVQAPLERVDGLLVVSLSPRASEVTAIERAGVPIVLVDAAHPRLPRIEIDDVAGGAIAAEHLADLGHERIGFVGDAPDRELGFRSSARRQRGFERTLAARGLPVAPERRRHGPHGLAAARRMAGELLAVRRPPTAIFAASDVQALGVLEAATGAGLSVPDDLSVVGFDDLPLAAHVGLTTVRQPLRESGRRGVRRLLGLLAGEAPGRLRELMPLALQIRRTTAAPGR